MNLLVEFCSNKSLWFARDTTRYILKFKSQIYRSILLDRGGFRQQIQRDGPKEGDNKKKLLIADMSANGEGGGWSTP